MKRIFKHMFRRGQTGQTLVILAFGFIVLLGFVGIVTDVSLLFVRYSTLRRAVDSAAVAAAGQLRRVAPNAQDQADVDAARAKGVTLTLDGVAYARNLATVNLAARQFVEFYGLSPSNVLVETCQTTDYKDAELCTDDQRKLVRVTAQVASPTVFLRLLGWGTVTLEASAISESAVLDVVLILDVSESMTDTTTYADWAAIGKGARVLPPRLDKAVEKWKIETDAANGLDNDPGDYYTQILGMTMPEVLDNQYIKEQMKAYVMNGTTPELVDFSDSRLPRPTCRVRYYPEGWEIDGDLLAEYRKLMPDFPPKASNFVPLYDFYGCCNDPNGDGDFSDLVCQPFKQARDASLNFIEQVDFARGDRVGIVTFSRGAYLMKPVTDEPGQSPMLETEADAREVLNKAVGVRAEESFYRDTDGNGMWDAYAIAGGSYLEPVSPGDLPDSKYGTYWDEKPIGELTDIPVKRNCPFLMASVSNWNSLWSSISAEADAHRYPNPLVNIMRPDYIRNTSWAALWPTLGHKTSQMAKYSYEYRASCADTNIGAGLRTANNALLNPDTWRTNGAVWVMVMLSDGGAGASDQGNTYDKANTTPVQYLSPASPYNGDPANPPTAGDYGVYGVCPTGTSGSPSELITDKNDGFPFCSDLKPESRHLSCFDPTTKDKTGSIYIDVSKPACDEASSYDVDDYARDWADYVGLIDPFPYLEDREVQKSSDALLPTIFTIGFNLKFNDTTERCTEGKFFKGDALTEGDYERCLGEELLRYIADVGDNFQIDTDYQQDYRNDGDANLIVAPDNWGQRGPCEDPIPGGYADPDAVKAASQPFETIINPKPAGENCGNYFNATDGLALEQVFDEIAARMFTRLSR